MEFSLQPHHDGSELYVPNQLPRLHEKIKLRVRIHSSIGDIAKVLVRRSENGEVFFSQRAKPFPGDNGWSWWETSIEMVNPQVNYRFLIELVGGEAWWLNSVGVSKVEPIDALDFRINTFSEAPQWGRESVMYQIFPDRFAKSSQADTRELPSWAIKKDWDAPVSPTGEDLSTQFFGGDLDGIVEHLDHLESLGVGIIYLTPFFPGQSNHRYDATSFDSVDPLLGGDDALIRLVQAAHARGMKVMGDLTTNHSGSSHEWFRAAYKNPGAIEREFYYFSQGGDKYEAWWGIDTLPKFNWNSKELRRRFIEGPDSVVGKWLREPFLLDGWRIDVANMTGRLEGDDLYHEVAQTIRQTMREINPQALLLGEYTSDAQARMQGDGYHGAMTYHNFTKPLWLWFAGEQINIYPPFPGPGPKRYSGKEFLQAHLHMASAYPWHVRLNNMNALDTHDIPRFRTVSVLGGQQVGAVMQFTLPGIPVLFAGDEFGLEGINGEHSRTPLPWNQEREYDKNMLPLYSELAKIRAEHPTLVTGSIRWLYASNEAVVFAREDDEATILVACSRFGDPNVKLPLDALTDIEQAKRLFGEGDLIEVGSSVMIPAPAKSAAIWRLPPPKH